MIRFLKQKNPSMFVLLFFFSMAANAIYYFLPFPVPLTEHSFLMSFVEIDPDSFPKWLGFGIISSAVFLSAIHFNSIVNRFRLLNELTILPAFIFVTLEALFPQMFFSVPAMLSMFFMTLILTNLLMIFDIENAVQKLFFTGFYTGLACLVYSPMVIFFPVILLLVPMIKRPKWNEIAIIPFGFFFPFYFTGMYFYFKNQLSGFINDLFYSFPVIQFFHQFHFTPSLITAIFLGLGILVCFFITITRPGSVLVRTVRYNRTFLVFFIVILMLFFFTTANKYMAGSLFLIPFTMVVSSAFNTGNRRFYDVMYFGILLAAGFSQYNITRFGFY